MKGKSYLVAFLAAGFALSVAADNPKRIGHSTFLPRNSNPDDSGLYNVAIDPANGYAYFLGNYLWKLDITGCLPTPVCSPLNTGNSSHMAIDTNAGYIYMSRITFNRFAVGIGTNAVTSAGTIAPAAGSPGTIFLDDSDPNPTNHYAYVVCTSAGNLTRIAKIDLGSFKEINSAPLASGETNAGIGAMSDPAKGYGYFITARPGRIGSEVVKIQMTTGTNLPVRVGAVNLGATNESFDGNVIDTVHGYAYFGTYGNTNLPSRIYKLKLEEGNVPPTVVGSIDLHEGQARLSLPVIDTVNGFVYFANDNTYPGGVHQFSLNGTNLPIEIGYVPFLPGASNSPPDGISLLNTTTNADGVLPYGEIFFRSAAFDPVRGNAYFGQDSRPNQVVKVHVAQPDPFAFTGIKTANGAFQIAFSNIMGGTFNVLTTTNLFLSPSNWTLLGAATDSPLGQFQFTDPTATNIVPRYYRIRSP